jgi:hypothetical protein
MVYLFLEFLGTSILISIVAVLIYIPTKSGKFNHIVTCKKQNKTKSQNNKEDQDQLFQVTECKLDLVVLNLYIIVLFSVYYQLKFYLNNYIALFTPQDANNQLPCILTIFILSLKIHFYNSYLSE